MLCQCWSYFFHWFNIDKMSNVLILYQCHFKTCCYNVTLTSYRWLYQHWTLNVLLRCCKSTHIKKGQVCDASLWWVKSQGWKRKENFNLPPYGHDLTPRGKKNPINLGGQFATLKANVVTIKYRCFDEIHIVKSK